MKAMFLTLIKVFNLCIIAAFVICGIQALFFMINGVKKRGKYWLRTYGYYRTICVAMLFALVFETAFLNWPHYYSMMAKETIRIQSRNSG